MSAARIDKIRKCLEESFAPEMLMIEDESHLHAGHQQAGDMGHFKVKIMAEAFHAKPLVQSHKEIYAALGDLMQTEIHALSIKIHKKSS